MCAFSPCQRDVRVTLKREDGSVFDHVFEALPGAVQAGALVIYGGQTLYFEAEVVDGLLANIKVVERVLSPSKTITAKFEQLAEGGMSLSLHNPLASDLKFDMMIMSFKSERLYPTSSCTLVAGKSLFEHWPEPLFQVLLFRGRAVKASNSVTCS